MRDQSVPYQSLNPDTILSAIESTGVVCNGQFLALNSYENRVYQVGIEEGEPLITKFYRPERWNDEAIIEEHQFACELSERDIPVIPPIVNAEGVSLHHYEGFRFALFQRKGGRWPELDKQENLEWIGRFMGRIHSVGMMYPFQYRSTLVSYPDITASRDLLLNQNFIPDYLQQAYKTVTDDLLVLLASAFDDMNALRLIRLHGDCHAGNILWTSDGPHFVDFDDCCTGPAIQDLWMLLSGDASEMSWQLSCVLRGYGDFCDFDFSQLHLIEALRTMRILKYSAWLAKRWHDPAFPQNFPWFDTARYWEEHIQSLREQLFKLNDADFVLTVDI